jgi:hypothetical protein
MIRRYRTRPSEVAAAQWDGNNLTEMDDLAGARFAYRPVPGAKDIAFIAVSATSWVSLGKDQWVVRDRAGALYVHTPAEFTNLYEETP